jgi:N-acetyl-beta-hexosaminidase
MIKSDLFSLLFFFFTLDLAIAQVQPEIIPMPYSYKLMDGEFLWDHQVGLLKDDFPDQGTYLQQEDQKYGRKWAGAFAPLAAVYDFEVNDFDVTPEERSLILGIQANLWTETVYNEQRFDFLMYPRIAALAEAVWSQKEVKSYSMFMNRLSVHLEKYKAEKIYYFDSFELNNHPEPVYEP